MLLVSLLTAAVAVPWVAGAGAADTRSAAKSPQLSGPSLESAVAKAGRHYYMRYCAACHGFEARGDGAVAAALTIKPPDLTKITERHEGTFPMDEIAATIDGRKLPASHGARDMPVWGERFAPEFRQDPSHEQVVRGQLLMLLVYLRSIQR